MKKFFRLRARKAARAREEIRVFWERRSVSAAATGPPLPPVAPEASLTSSSDTPEDVVAEREYRELLANGASDEEILEWATRTEVWDFVP